MGLPPVFWSGRIFCRVGDLCPVGMGGHVRVLWFVKAVGVHAVVTLAQ